MNRIGWLVVTLCLICEWTCLCPNAEGLPSRPIQVLVVGTIHQQHATDKNYSYADIARILATYNPDLICVEIRPKDFRRHPYLKEMELATIWGLSHGKRVAPIDWWLDKPDDREIRAKLAKEPEYIAKEKQFRKLLAHDEIVAQFQKLYGSLDDEYKWGSKLGYRFWNGREWNDVNAEVYRLSLEVYGDSPFNLHYLTRNKHMMELIWNAIRENSSHRVIVLTGNEHKAFFDKGLRKNPEIQVVDFDSILPLKTGKLDPSITRFLDDDDDLAYFQKGYPKDLDGYYSRKLIPLVHGPDMDTYPARVPPANIKLAGKILMRWKSALPTSDRETYEWGWYRFLNQDYAGAAVLLRRLAKRVDEGRVSDKVFDAQFIRVETYLDLGRSYDMLNERTKALACYRRVEKLLAGTRLERAKAYILQNYETVPYHRSQTR